MRGAPAANVDKYLEEVESDIARSTLMKIRSIIRDEIPEAEETISYGIPIYNYHGMVVGFAAFKNHCSLFPGHSVADFTEELKGYKTSKGTVQFPIDEMPPEPLIRAIVRKRFDENVQIHFEKQKK